MKFITASRFTTRHLSPPQRFSDRYISDRFLPDKAIDLVDEACALIKTEMNSMPSEMDEISREIMRLEIEETALTGDNDEHTQEHLAEIRRELAEKRDKFNNMKARWDNERNAISKVQQLRERIEQVNADIARAQNEYDLNRAAQLKYGELPGLQKELQKEEALAANRENSLLRDMFHPRRLQKSLRGGRASRFQSSWKASARNFCGLTPSCINASSDRMTPFSAFAMQF